MIIMGAGICQWFHGDATYRAILALLMLTGSMGRNGGGWAHYVGQEKCRPITGWATLAMALDWSRPPRQMIGTAFWYTHTDQWRYDGYRADALASPLAAARSPACTPRTPSRSPPGWAGCRRTRSSTAIRSDLADEAAAAGNGAPARTSSSSSRPAAAVRVRGPGRARELAAGADAVAGEPAGLVGQGQRVLPPAPAGHPLATCAPTRRRRTCGRAT